MEDIAQQLAQMQIGEVNVHDSGTVHMGCTIKVSNCRACQTHEHQTASNSSSSILDDASLREYYIDSLCLAAPLPWYSDYTWDIAEIYTDLAIEGCDERFPLENLFEHAEKRSRGNFFRILIEGDAGYGKSTLTLKLASDWAKRNTHERYNYLKPFDLLFVAQLGRVEGSGDLLNHMKSIYDEKINVPFEDVLKGNDDLQVLIVMDGYDEAKHATKKTVGRIMEKSLWSKSHVIVTSRLDHVPKEIKGKNFCVTVKGYETKQVAVAVGKFFIKSGQLTKENAVLYSLGQTTEKDFESIDDSSSIARNKQPLTEEHFQTFLHNVLEESPYKELAQCPLLCAMMCCLICEFPNYKLPETLSELYFAVINRNLCRADAKDSIAVGDDCDEWDWDFFNRNFCEDHHDFLNDFGSLCLEGLMENDMLFTLFQLTGEKKAKPSDPKIRQLVKAGVVIKSCGESVNTMYQVPHRTMAEFLAAYYLAREKDTRKAESHLLKLCARKTSFGAISAFCFELDSGKIVVDAIREVKLPNLATKDFRPVAVGAETFSKVTTPALPCSRDLLGSPLSLLDVAKYFPKLLSLAISPVPSYESFTGLMMGVSFNNVTHEHLWGFGKTSVRNESSTHPSFTFEVARDTHWDDLLKWLLVLVDQKIQLHTVNLSVEKNFQGYPRRDDVWHEDFVASLQLLLKSDLRPKAMSFIIDDGSYLQNLCNAFENLPDNYMLERLHLKYNSFPPDRDLELMDRVVEEFSKRCKKLSLNFCLGLFAHFLQSNLRFPSGIDERLTSLCIRGGRYFRLLYVHRLLICINGSNLEELKLQDLDLYFQTAQLKKMDDCAGCKLERLTLKNVQAHFPEPNDLDLLESAVFALDTLELVYCESRPKLLQWLASSVFPLRHLKSRIFDKSESSVDLVAALDCFSAKHAETLKFLDLRFGMDSFGVWSEEDIEQLQASIRRFQRLEGVRLYIKLYYGKDDLTETYAFAILNIHRLNALKCPPYNEPFFNTLARLAHKWPGEDGLAPGQAASTLTLEGLSNDDSIKMGHLFLERDIDFRLKEIARETYGIWFPPKSIPPNQSDQIDASPSGSMEPTVE